jgi:hypothetical protein
VTALRSALYALRSGSRVKSVQPRFVIGLLLIAAGVLWSIPRGVHWYGLDLAGLGYDLDQPPLLMVLLGCWMLYRSRVR